MVLDLRYVTYVCMYEWALSYALPTRVPTGGTDWADIADTLKPVSIWYYYLFLVLSNILAGITLQTMIYWCT